MLGLEMKHIEAIVERLKDLEWRVSNLEQENRRLRALTDLYGDGK